MEHQTFGAYGSLNEQAALAHLQGDYPAALRYAMEGHSVLTGERFEPHSQTLAQQAAPLNASEQSEVGANLRNIAARLERLGRDEPAEETIHGAITIHQALVQTALRGNGYVSHQEIAHHMRELAADLFYVGSFGLKHAMQVEQAGQPSQSTGQQAVDAMRQSQQLFTDADQHDGTIHHQYHINGLGPFSMAESLFGDPHQGRQLAWQALKAAGFSEPDRTPAERRKAVTKARLRAIGALGVQLCMTIGARHTAVKATQRLL